MRRSVFLALVVIAAILVPGTARAESTTYIAPYPSVAVAKTIAGDGTILTSSAAEISASAETGAVSVATSAYSNNPAAALPGPSGSVGVVSGGFGRGAASFVLPSFASPTAKIKVIVKSAGDASSSSWSAAGLASGRTGVSLACTNSLSSSCFPTPSDGAFSGVQTVALSQVTDARPAQTFTSSFDISVGSASDCTKPTSFSITVVVFGQAGAGSISRASSAFDGTVDSISIQSVACS